MLKLTTKVTFATIVVAGSATVASATFDPDGANRFQRLAAAAMAARRPAVRDPAAH